MANGDIQASDAFLGALQSTPKHASLSPDAMELMGKQAADALLGEGTPLNQSIKKLASAHTDINAEQVKRISEFANTAVYLALHEKNKTAAAESSYPQFTLADPSTILQDMNNGARPSVPPPAADTSYSSAPKGVVKVSSARADALLDELFEVEAIEKRASAEFTSETVVNDLLAQKDGLVGVKGHLSERGENFDLRLKEASADYYLQVRNHLLEGGSFADVMVAARGTGATDEKIATVMKPFVERLLTEKIARAQVLADGVRNLEKVAHRVVNPQHPLVAVFADVVTLHDETTKVAAALDIVEDELMKVNSFIRETYGARATR